MIIKTADLVLMIIALKITLGLPVLRVLEFFLKGVVIAFILHPAFLNPIKFYFGL